MVQAGGCGEYLIHDGPSRAGAGRRSDEERGRTKRARWMDRTKQSEPVSGALFHYPPEQALSAPASLCPGLPLPSLFGFSSSRPCPFMIGLQVIALPVLILGAGTLAIAITMLPSALPPWPGHAPSFSPAFTAMDARRSAA